MVACAVRADDGTIIDLDVDDLNNCFYDELAPISDSWIPEAAAVSGLDRNHLIQHGSNPTTSMNNLVAYVNRTVANSDFPQARPVFMAYPLGFDWLFTYWYLMNYAKNSPFGHSSHLDIKTYFSAKANREIRKSTKRSMPKSLHSNRKHTHNALDDAREQGELGRNILRWERPAV